jgi:hypothetical protein
LASSLNGSVQRTMAMFALLKSKLLGVTGASLNH